MSIITESLQNRRLKKFNINIKTKFQDGSKVLERNTDNSKNDDIKSGIILNKSYYKDGKVSLVEKNFNPRILYSFLINDELAKNITCPNCGNTGILQNFTNGCPYCGTYYNVDYSYKDLGSKYNYDQIMSDNKYVKKTLLIDVIFCLALSFIFFKTTGRTFTIFDILKILGFAGIGSLLFFYVFYYLDAVIITIPVKRIKDKQNALQMEFWNEMEKKNISKSIFFNNLNSELKEYFYSDKIEKNQNIVDFDILEYDKYSYFIDNKNRLNIKVGLKIRIVSVEGNNIISKEEDKEFILRQNEIEKDELHPGANIIKCHNCGSSIDVTKDKCDYCGTPIHYMQNWYIVTI